MNAPRLVLVSALALTLAACGDKGPSNPSPPPGDVDGRATPGVPAPGATSPNGANPVGANTPPVDAGFYSGGSRKPM